MRRLQFEDDPSRQAFRWRQYYSSTASGNDRAKSSFVVWVVLRFSSFTYSGVLSTFSLFAWLGQETASRRSRRQVPNPGLIVSPSKSLVIVFAEDRGMAGIVSREWNRMEAPSLCLRSASSWEGKAPGGESRQVHFQSLRSTLTPHSTALDGHRHRRHDALLDNATWFRSTLLYSGCSPPRRPSAPRPAPSAAAGANLPTTRSTRRTTSGDDAGGWSTWTTPR